MDAEPVYALMGPTACGKTGHALALAEQGFGLISVDSVLVYRGLDIGSAKPTPDEQARAPHALIDIRDFWDTYSAGDFKHDALNAIADCRARGLKPLLVGGTQMYFAALLGLNADLPRADSALRARLRARASVEGWPSLHGDLARIDPETAARLHPNHSSRIERALEVFELTGKPLSAFHSQAVAPAINLKAVGLLPADRGWLHNRIELRCQLMLEQGFLAELERLREHPRLDLTLPSLMSVGYRQGLAWLPEQGVEALMAAMVPATRQLAKRQLTWLRKWPDLVVVDAQAATTEQVLAALLD